MIKINPLILDFKQSEDCIAFIQYEVYVYFM